jgi:hypothetical protein
MKTAHARIYGFNAGKMLIVFAMAAMIGSIGVAPAIGDDDHKNNGKHENGRYKQKGHGYNRDRYGQGGSVHRSTVYTEQVYVPPPVVYAPPPPPGISIFFPSISIHP